MMINFSPKGDLVWIMWHCCQLFGDLVRHYNIVTVLLFILPHFFVLKFLVVKLSCRDLWSWYVGAPQIWNELPLNCHAAFCFKPVLKCIIFAVTNANQSITPTNQTSFVPLIWFFWLGIIGTLQSGFVCVFEEWRYMFVIYVYCLWIDLVVFNFALSTPVYSLHAARFRDTRRLGSYYYRVETVTRLPSTSRWRLACKHCPC